VVAQELGLVGGLAVIGFYVVFAYRGVRTALNAPDTFGALLAVGITAWLTLQAFINIGVVVVLIPITGITLPFVSAGGSSLLVSFTAVGILLSISRETLPRRTFNDADSDRRRWDGRPRLSRAGRRALPARTGA
ncbi:MAG: FtsW/RodA/SpoVE family cell cycle protein, partial [Candidatus Limnocylindrales bacterium]